jgi:hypothetical protein
MGQTVTGEEESRIRWKEPDVDQVEDIAIVAEVKEEIVPQSFLVIVCSYRE